MGGPNAGDEHPLSEVIICRFCTGPVLTLFQRGAERQVPSDCPRKTEKVGECDGCRKFRASLVEMHDAPTSLRVAAQTILATVLLDPDLKEAWSEYDQSDLIDIARRWVALLAGVMHNHDDPVWITRAMVLEIMDGPLETAWMAKTTSSRRFAIRCWTGVVRNAISQR